jgi:hypothetical protein
MSTVSSSSSVVQEGSFSVSIVLFLQMAQNCVFDIGHDSRGNRRCLLLFFKRVAACTTTPSLWSSFSVFTLKRGSLNEIFVLGSVTSSCLLADAPSVVRTM